jgi:uncharacterized protein
MNPATAARPTRHWTVRLFRSLMSSALLFLLLLTACQSKLIYFPSAYRSGEPEGFARQGGKRLDYTTRCGRQSAWLLPPRDGKRTDRFWIVCAGNGARALDMEEFCRALPFPGDAWLLVDYPGYGECEGSPHPDTIRENLRAAVPLAAKELGLDTAEIAGRGCVFGHSLGSAAALIAAEECKVRRAVLCSPFTSIMDMTRVMLKVPLGFIVRHRFDNRATLSSLRNAGGRAWILHGASDEVIPVEMGRTLGREFPETVTFRELDGVDHNGILESSFAEITAAMAEARRL